MNIHMKKESTISDASLVLAFQKGDHKVIPILVKRWHVTFCKLAFFYVKNADVAKDIAQESWIVVLSKLSDIKEPDKCKSWAISIVNRKAIDWLRSYNRERIKLQTYFVERPKIQFETEESNELKVKKQLILAIEKLSPNQQQVLKLFYGQGYSLKEIGTIMNTTAGNSKSRLFHAREKLKSIFKNNNYE